MTRIFTDQMNRTVEVNFPPQRIISLVPSQTELLFDLGLEKEVVGITKFCVHPDQWFQNKTRIGGTKNVNLDKILELQPDLIIGNMEENQKDQIERLAETYPVWMSDIKTLEDALQMISEIGKLTNQKEKAKEVHHEILSSFESFQEQIQGLQKKRAAYFIWRNPYMVAAADTFIDHMLDLAGFENAYGDQQRYPEIHLEDLQNRNIELILLSSEPYPFKEKHFDAFIDACPGAKVIIVDGELFSWYGSRLVHSIEYFKALKRQLW